MKIDDATSKRSLLVRLVNSLLVSSVRLGLSLLLIASGLWYLKLANFKPKPVILPAESQNNQQPKNPVSNFLAEAAYIPDARLPDQDGDKSAVITRVTTSQPVVFLTIDDGLFQDQAVADYMKSNSLPASLFLNNYAISKNYDYFKRMIQDGSQVENHTVNHPKLTKLPYDQQKSEICNNADAFAKVFEQRPKLLRPPYGLYDDQTRKAALECGMKILVMWDVVIEKGGLHFQPEISGLRAGDIVLLHFKPGGLDDLKVFKQAADQAGLSVRLLEDYLK